jgi:hypothetical protein
MLLRCGVVSRWPTSIQTCLRCGSGRGWLYHACGETGLARDHRRQALALYAELDLAEADEA